MSNALFIAMVFVVLQATGNPAEDGAAWLAFGIIADIFSSIFKS
jgi:preprotein translocase subunit SecF